MLYLFEQQLFILAMLILYIIRLHKQFPAETMRSGDNVPGHRSLARCSSSTDNSTIQLCRERKAAPAYISADSRLTSRCFYCRCHVSVLIKCHRYLPDDDKPIFCSLHRSFQLIKMGKCELNREHGKRRNVIMVTITNTALVTAIHLYIVSKSHQNLQVTMRCEGGQPSTNRRLEK